MLPDLLPELTVTNKTIHKWLSIEHIVSIFLRLISVQFDK